MCGQSKQMESTPPSICTQFIERKLKQVKHSEFKSYDDLPLFLNAATVAKVLGIAPSSSYELMHEADFPVLKTGNRMVVPKEKFIHWVSSTRREVSVNEKTPHSHQLAPA